MLLLLRWSLSFGVYILVQINNISRSFCSYLFSVPFVSAILVIFHKSKLNTFNSLQISMLKQRFWIQFDDIKIYQTRVRPLTYGLDLLHHVFGQAYNTSNEFQSVEHFFSYLFFYWLISVELIHILSLKIFMTILIMIF